jgi:hypothetical protein
LRQEVVAVLEVHRCLLVLHRRRSRRRGRRDPWLARDCELGVWPRAASSTRFRHRRGGLEAEGSEICGCGRHMSVGMWSTLSAARFSPRAGRLGRGPHIAGLPSQGEPRAWSWKRSPASSRGRACLPRAQLRCSELACTSPAHGLAELTMRLPWPELAVLGPGEARRVGPGGARRVGPGGARCGRLNSWRHRISRRRCHSPPCRLSRHHRKWSRFGERC